MNRPMKTRLLILALLSVALPASAAPAKPNVVYILSDDVGWGDLSVHGGGVPTPNIDRLFSQGVELTQFMGWCVCSPTRAMLLTGRHPIRVGTGPEIGGELDAGGNDHRRRLPGQRLPHRRLRQMAQRRTIPTRRNSARPSPRRSSTCRTRNSRAATASTRTASTRRGSTTAAVRTISTAAPSRARGPVSWWHNREFRPQDEGYTDDLVTQLRHRVHSREQGPAVLLLRALPHRPRAAAGQGGRPGRHRSAEGRQAARRQREDDRRGQAHPRGDAPLDGQERRRHRRRAREAGPERKHHLRLHQRQRRDGSGQQPAAARPQAHHLRRRRASAHRLPLAPRRTRRRQEMGRPLRRAGHVPDADGHDRIDDAADAPAGWKEHLARPARQPAEPGRKLLLGLARRGRDPHRTSGSSTASSTATNSTTSPRTRPKRTTSPTRIPTWSKSLAAKMDAWADSLGRRAQSPARARQVSRVRRARRRGARRHRDHHRQGASPRTAWPSPWPTGAARNTPPTGSNTTSPSRPTHRSGIPISPPSKATTRSPSARSSSPAPAWTSSAAIRAPAPASPTARASGNTASSASRSTAPGPLGKHGVVFTGGTAGTFTDLPRQPPHPPRRRQHDAAVDQRQGHPRRKVHGERAVQGLADSSGQGGGSR